MQRILKISVDLDVTLSFREDTPPYLMDQRLAISILLLHISSQKMHVEISDMIDQSILTASLKEILQ